MASCDVCGNDYNRSFEVITSDGTRHRFDSLECAAQKIAPTCPQCGCRVLGHGIETDRGVCCCAHCANHGGTATEAVDNITRASD